MAKEEAITLRGRVVEALAGARFKVEPEGGHIILAHVSGKMRRHYIRILPGDGVTVELSPYDMTRGRITYRGGRRSPFGRATVVLPVRCSCAGLRPDEIRG